MTDTERRRLEAICKVARVNDIGELSDGFHTFNSLYEQRMILFAALVKAYKDKAWKSYRHEDGEYCFGGGWFIVGIDTPEGSYTYHYENKHWDMFDCIDLPRAKHWDGHTEADAETRLMSLPERKTDGDTISRQATYLALVEKGQASKRYKLGETWELNGKEIREVLDALPSVQPERKKGRWIVIVKGCKLTSYKCSECGRYIADDTGYDVKKDYPFCHCGADMREDTDE